MAYNPTRYWDLGFAAETSFGTEQTSGFVRIPVEPTSPSLARTSQESPERRADFGGRAANIFGSKNGGSIELTFPMRGAASGYDESTDAETEFPAERDLILAALGAGTANAPASISYASEGMDTSANAYTPTVDTGAEVAGQFFASDGLSYGFVSESNSATPANYTLAQAGTDNPPSANGDILPAYTGWLSSVEPTSFTLRLYGRETEHGMILIGCLPTEVTLSYEDGQVMTCTISMQFTDHKIDDTIGGLDAQQARQSLPPVIESGNGRVVVGTSTGGTKRCGMRAGTLTISNEYGAVPCAHKPGGVNVRRTDATVTASIQAVWDNSDTVTSNLHEWEYQADQRADEAIGVYVGDGAGRIMGWFMPAAVIQEQPTIGEIDGFTSWEFEARASGPFGATHDGSASTNAGSKSVFLWGFA